MIRKPEPKDIDAIVELVKEFHDPRPQAGNNHRGVFVEPYSRESALKDVNYNYSLVAYDQDELVGVCIACSHEELPQDFFEAYSPIRHLTQYDYINAAVEQDMPRDAFAVVQRVVSRRPRVALRLYKELSKIVEEPWVGGEILSSADYDKRVCNEASFKFHLHYGAKFYLEKKHGDLWFWFGLMPTENL